MGTSAAYSAPPSWGDLKSAVTTVAGKPLTPQKVGNLVRSFVEHNGGSGGIARNGGGSVAKGGNARSTANRLGAFISDVGRVGLDETLRANGWDDLIGRPVSEVLHSLIDRLGGESSTIDDVDARMALAALEKEYFEAAQTPEELEELMQVQVGRIEEVLQDYFALYLYEVFCRVFFERLVQRAGEMRAFEVLNQVKGFIRAKLEEVAIQRDIGRIDWKGADGQRVTTDIMESTLRVFE